LIQLYVNIKIYQPGCDVYVRFNIKAYIYVYAYAFTCEFRQAPNTVAVLFYYGRAEWSE